MLRRELAPAAALRAAKLERLRDPATAPPAHWAAFVLWGFPD
jgi:CHAT domain-containing protein